MRSNYPNTSEKREALLELARERQSTRLDGYACINDFHDGIFECGHVSPFTKSGFNINAEIMIVAQDWSSSDTLSRYPPDRDSAMLGYSPNLPTNKNLDSLLERHFGLKRDSCYLTNLFPFIKSGNMSTGIHMKVLVDCAKRFTIKEISIVSPALVLCLGLRTFLALSRAAGRKGSLKMAEAVKSPFDFENSMVHCVAHTGALGMNNRGRDQVDEDWQTISLIRRN